MNIFFFDGTFDLGLRVAEHKISVLIDVMNAMQN